MTHLEHSRKGEKGDDLGGIMRSYIYFCDTNESNIACDGGCTTSGAIQAKYNATQSLTANSAVDGMNWWRRHSCEGIMLTAPNTSITMPSYGELQCLHQYWNLSSRQKYSTHTYHIQSHMRYSLRYFRWCWQSLQLSCPGHRTHWPWVNPTDLHQNKLCHNCWIYRI